MLFVDSKEHQEVIKRVVKAADKLKVMVEVKHLKTGDYLNTYMILESKEINDFVSSVVNVEKRKDGTLYKRMESQLERLNSAPQPIKILFIHGSTDDLHSQIHPNAVRGMVSSILAKYNGRISIFWYEHGDWIDQLLRLHLKTMKYGSLMENTEIEEKGVV